MTGSRPDPPSVRNRSKAATSARWSPMIPVKQEIRWRVPVGNSRYGGTLSTASNLVFQVAPDGRLIAYSADKGDTALRAAYRAAHRHGSADHVRRSTGSSTSR